MATSANKVLGLALLASVWALPASAASFNGTAVNPTNPTGGQVGITGTSDGVTGIEFFIPNNSVSGTYGVSSGGSYGTVGTSGDSTPAATLTMDVHFTGLTAGVASTLTLSFDDLDLINVNDPAYLHETVNVSTRQSNGTAGTSLTNGNVTTAPAVISAVSGLTSGGSVTGTSSTQQIVLNLTAGAITGTTLDLIFQFSSTDSPPTDGTNTPEYMNATLVQVAPVPLPAALPMFGAGLAGLGLLARRRKKKILA